MLSVFLTSSCIALFLVGLMYPDDIEKRKLLQPACLLMIIDKVLCSCQQVLNTRQDDANDDDLTSLLSFLYGPESLISRCVGPISAPVIVQNVLWTSICVGTYTWFAIIAYKWELDWHRKKILLSYSSKKSIK